MFLHSFSTSPPSTLHILPPLISRPPPSAPPSGPYLFTVDEENEKALPLERVFWDDLMDSTVDWGMETYEQDWLDRQYMFTT